MSNRETTAAEDQPGSADARITKLAEELYCERVVEARQMPPEEKLLAGEELFEYACAITLAGIRDQSPGAQRTRMPPDPRRKIGFAGTNGEAGMTTGESITVRVAEALEACGIPFLLSGSFVSNLGLHRAMVPTARHLGFNEDNPALSSCEVSCHRIRPGQFKASESDYCHYRR